MVLFLHVGEHLVLGTIVHAVLPKKAVAVEENGHLLEIWLIMS